MAINTSSHTNYARMSDELLKNRIAVLGSFFVKEETKFLPHPSQVDTESKEQQERYRKYAAGAEFPEFTKSTLTSMLDKMKIDDANIKLNSKTEYLINDSDGGGLSLRGLMESCASNILQVGWHVLLSDYQGLTGVDPKDVSIAKKKEANPRATIKQYPRESVRNWGFGSVNGALSLNYLLLHESTETIDSETGESVTVDSFLKLGIDGNGYYQQKVVESTLSGSAEGEKIYFPIDGSGNLNFIPAQIVAGCEVAAGELPLDTGFLTAIADLAYFRYIVSADYKECLASLVPIVIASGVSSMDDFEEDNGRRYFASGANVVNVVRDPDAKVTITESSQTLQQYEAYFKQNERDVKAIGGVYNSEAATQRTATEVINDSETQVSTLGPMVNSIEPAIKMAAMYCGIFEGIYSPKDVNKIPDDIEVQMARDFAVSKLTFNEVKTYIELFNNGQMSQQEMLRVLDLGGWTVSDAETLGLEIANSGGSLTD